MPDLDNPAYSKMAPSIAQVASKADKEYQAEALWNQPVADVVFGTPLGIILVDSGWI